MNFCPNCGIEIVPRIYPGGSPKVYCSKKCRTHASYLRHKYPIKKKTRIPWGPLGILVIAITLLFSNIQKPTTIVTLPPIERTVIQTVYVTNDPPVTIVSTPTVTSIPIVYARRLSENGFEFIRKWETLKNSMYNDASGNCTVGYGHIIAYRSCQKGDWPAYVSKDGAEVFLRQDVSKSEFDLFQANIDLTQTQYDAIISIIFNMGWDNFKKTGIYNYLISGEFSKIPQEIRLTCGDVNGIVWQGLISRRNAEAILFSEGKY